MNKQKLIPAIILVLVLALAAYFGRTIFFGGSKEPEVVNKRQIINAIAIPDRPFVALFPHNTGKLLTILIDKADAYPELTLDLEYLSGNALKGGRTSISGDTSFPYTQAFLLGSCSSGGKCSFDEDITTGTIKTKIESESEINVLKSNYAFVDGRTATTDQKVIFEPSKTLTDQYVLAQTHGFLGQLEGEPAAEPVVITSDNSDDIVGTLTLVAGEASSIVYFDGEQYQELEAEITDGRIVIDLDLAPWSQEVSIIRDDLKGAQEETTLYLVGPFVPLK